VLTASEDNTARLWEAESGKLLATFQGHTKSGLSAVFSPDGQRVLTASVDNTARLWEAESGRGPASASPSQAVIATSTKETLARTALQDATKDNPWVNSLGMKFVPVPGVQVLFSIWDTRVQDFEMFVKSTGYDATGGMYTLVQGGWRLQRGATWKEPGFSQEANHPVCRDALY